MATQTEESTNQNMAMNKEDDMEVTEQGLGTPVLVGTGSGQAGSHRSSTSDREVSSVAIQAVASNDTTGMERQETEIVFTRKPKIPRSPENRKNSLQSTSEYTEDESENMNLYRTPRRKNYKATEGTGSLGTELQEEKNTSTDSEVQASKRKRQNVSPEMPGTDENANNRSIEAIIKQVRKLEELIAKSYKPKKELTDISNRLTYHVKQLQKQPRNPSKKATEQTTQKMVTSTGTQANAEEIVEETNRKRAKRREEVERIFLYESGLEGITSIIDENWTEEFFKATKVVDEKLHETDVEEDLAVFIDPISPKKYVEYEDLKTRYPAVTTIVEEGLVDGVIEYMTLQVGVKSSRAEGEGNYSTSVFILPMKIDGIGMDDVETLFKLCTQLKNQVNKNNRRKLRIIIGDQYNHTYARKCIEFVFKNTEVKISMPRQKEKKATRSKSEKKDPRKVDTDKVIIKATEGKNYADILKAVKTSVNIEEEGIRIKSIRKTNKGDLMMEVWGGREKAINLKQIIQDKNENTNVVVKTPETVVHITDIDASINEQELRREISEAEYILESEFRVISMRPTQNGNQTATVAMKKSVAEKVVKRGRIKIGWINCRARKRVNLLRCFRCHLFGHAKNECPNEDKSQLCLRCAKPGHIAKDCKELPTCIVCKVEGHRMDQTKCPEYRKLIGTKTRTVSIAGSVFGNDN